ncbi:MAG: tRNA 2-thiouridine(34) synthase MnmA [Gammaproteobacteria bacterium]
MRKPRVVVGLSGGVDSSVAALLLREQGYDVHAVFMKNWEDSFEVGYCSAQDDLRDAEDVCALLDIPLHKVNFSAEYRERVFAHFLAEYQSGRTPNPDVLCNTEIKFKAFMDYAERLGADAIATGHYARCYQNGCQRLLKGADTGKDQSYFLHGLNQAQLGKALFPVGHLEKREVRAIAEQADLVTHAKKDSTGICFIGERDFRAFLGHYFPAQPGPIRTPEGETLGQHQGLMFYTLGQRQGLGIGGQHDGSGAAWYVAAKDLAHNTLIVVQGNGHPMLYHRRLRASGLHWIGVAPTLPLRARAKTRYRQPDQDCLVTPLADDRCEVVFDQPQRALTPGQSVVFYAAEECLGGAVIDEALD